MDSIILFDKKENCSGCGACGAVCPQHAIEMKEDELGVVYPYMNKALCIGCGKCLAVCTAHTEPEVQPREAYAALVTQKDIYEKSASGGIFAGLASMAMEKGIRVAGAVMDVGEKGAEVYHILSHRPEDVVRMQGSKYVQSNAARCYKPLMQAVKAGETVLFPGTPCQVQAVKNLTGDPANLITVDLICHGVPPVKMLREFLMLQGKRLGGRVTEISFRDKSAPKPFTARLQIRRGKKQKVYRLRSGYLSYYRYFLEGVTYRESCYDCPFAGMKRAGDLTIGDYWGVEKHHAAQIETGEIPFPKDISCILVNTEKGKCFLQDHSQSLQLWETQPQWVAQTNRQLCCPSEKHPRRNSLLKIYEAGGYSALEKQFIADNGGWLRYTRRYRKAMRTGK